MTVPPIVERLRLALEHVLQTPVHVITHEEWASANRTGGEPVRLPAPLGPYVAIQRNSDFEVAVASATPFAEVPGFHHVRRDERDAPNVINVDSHQVILDLPSDPKWSEVVRVSGLSDEEGVRAALLPYAFAYARNRDDHHAPEVPADIASAQPREPEDDR